ncbi:MAG TPA: hypothetical protein VFS39_03815 [Nitrospira sp.]|nr:hypothetical protein [Nitrospira sp.]
MGLGTNHMTITTGAKFIPEVWIDELRTFLRSALYLADKCKLMEMEGKKGDVLHIPDISEMTTNAKVAGSQVTLQTFTEGEFTLTIDKHREASWVIEDLLEIQSMYDKRSAYTQSAGYAVAKDIDTALATLCQSLDTKVIGSDGATTAANKNGTDLSEAGLRQCIERLDTANVPDDGGRCLWIHPAQKNVLLGISRFTEYQMIGMGGMPIRSGQFGEIFGLPVYVSTNVQGSGTGHMNLIFHRNWAALAVQSRPRVQAQYKQEYLGWLFTVDVVYGYAIFRNNHANAIWTPQ